MSKMTRETDYLTISIPTEDPEGMRQQLINGLMRSMRNYIVAQDDSTDQLALMELLKHLMPGTESQN